MIGKLLTAHKIGFNTVSIKPAVHKNSNIYRRNTVVNINKKVDFDASKVVWNGKPLISVDPCVINNETKKSFHFNQIMYVDNKEVFYVSERSINKTITECIKLRCKYQNAVIIAGCTIPTPDLLKKLDGIIDIMHIGVSQEMKYVGIDYPIASLLLESIYLMNKHRSNIRVACSDVFSYSDVNKALACGVDFVIIDDMVRGCTETAGVYKWIDQRLYKCCNKHVSVCKNSISGEIDSICKSVADTVFYLNGTNLDVLYNSDLVLLD